MSIMITLTGLGVQASLVGAEPTNETEYTERVTHIGGASLPTWSELQPSLVETENANLRRLVNAERDRRINQDFTFNGHTYQSDVGSRENINGAYALALSAKVAGAQAGDYTWHGGAGDFTWLASDNVSVLMDVDTVLAFGQAAAAHKRDLIMKAHAIKALDPIPADYADDSHWI